MHFYYDGARNPKAWIKICNLYQATDDIYVRLHDDGGMHYTWHLLPGFRTDGGSVPAAFRWFVPSWSDTDDVLNIAYATHDAIYSSGLASREIADEMLYSMLLESELSRWKAKLVFWAVHNFAADHYGPSNDTDDNDLFVDLSVYANNPCDKPR